MARIDFAFGAQDRLIQACQTVLRQFQAGQRVLVYCPDAERMKSFDKRLWAIEDTAFVPHVASDNPLAGQTAVILIKDDLASALSLAGAQAWLLNLADECPESLGKISRVLEIVSEDEADKEAARKRWAMYKSMGHDLKSHRLPSVRSHPG